MNANEAMPPSPQFRPIHPGRASIKPLTHPQLTLKSNGDVSSPEPKKSPSLNKLDWEQWSHHQIQPPPDPLHQNHLSVPSYPMTKTILVIQQREKYARFWQQILSSQGHRVRVEAPQEDLMLLIEQHRPNLVLVDMSIGNFNPYALCRDCQKRCPESRVILTHPPQREVQEAERRWATYQGAAELLTTPKDPTGVGDCLISIYQAIGWTEPLDQPKLMDSLQVLNWLPKPEETAPPTPIPPESTATKPAQKSPTPLMYRGRPVVR